MPLAKLVTWPLSVPKGTQKTSTELLQPLWWKKTRLKGVENGFRVNFIKRNHGQRVEK